MSNKHDIKLWKAVSDCNLQEFHKLLNKGADVACVYKGKTLLQVGKENYDLQVRTAQTHKANAYAQIMQHVQTELNKQVVEAANKGTAPRLVELRNAGGDLYQIGLPNGASQLGIIQLAATANGDNVDALKVILDREPRNIQAITWSCDSQVNKGLHVLAREMGNGRVADVLEKHLVYALLRCPGDQDGGFGTLMRLRAFGLDLNTPDEQGNTVLFHAVMRRNLPLVKELVEKYGANHTIRNGKGKTLNDVCTDLEPREPDLEKYLKTVFMNDDLLEVIRERKSDLDMPTLKQTLNRGCNPNCLDSEGNSATMIAIQLKCPVDIIKELVQSHSADLEVVNKHGQRALELAILWRSPTTVRALIDLGADVKRGNTTLLQFAKEHKKLETKDEIAQAIKEKLLSALQEQQVEKVKELYQCGADVNGIYNPTKDEFGKGWTPLHFAVDKGDAQMIDVLFACGANLNATDANGMPPVALAAKTGNAETVRVLIKLGADIHAEDNKGDTPLHIATQHNQFEIVTRLLYFGADEHKKNGKGDSPMDLAAKAKDQSIRNCLLNLDLQHQWSGCKVNGNAVKAQEGVAVSDYCPPVVFPDLTIRPVQMIPTGDKKRNEELASAAANGNWIKVEQAIHNGADIRYRRNGLTGRMLALEAADKATRKLNTVKMMDRPQYEQMKKACENTASNFVARSTQILWDEVERGTLERVATLHDVGAQLNAPKDLQDQLGVPGMLVRNQDNPEILNYLIEKDETRANFNAIQALNSRGESCLGIARYRRHENCARYLVARLSERLHDSVMQNKIERCKYFLSLGALPSVSGLRNTLEVAIINENFEIVKLLADAGANVLEIPSEVLRKVKNRGIVSFINVKRLNQSLRDAVRQVNLQEVEKLHRRGAEINDQNYLGDNCVSLAVRTGNLRLVHYFLSRGGSIVHGNKYAPTNIRQAEHLGNKDMVEYLQAAATTRFEEALRVGDLNGLDQLFAMPGFNVNEHQLPDGETPATLAVKNHGIDLVQWLWKQNIPLTQPNQHGDYPIGLAAANGDFAVVRFLVQDCKLDKNVKNKQGKTPLMLAEEAEYKVTAEFLRTGKVDEEKMKDALPKQTIRQLLEAVRKARLPAIKDFIAEVYQHRDLKIKCCKDMIALAKHLKAEQIRVMLEKHLKELEEDTSGFKLTGSRKFQRVLDGFLQGLSKIVAGVDFDENDEDAMMKLTQMAQSRTERLYKGFESYEKIESDMQAVQKDIMEKQDALRGYMTDINTQKEELDKRLDDDSKLDPIRRIQMRNEIKNLTTQANTTETFLMLLERKQQTMMEKQNALHKFKENDGQQYTFFETICTKLDTYLINAKWSFSEHSKQKESTKQAEKQATTTTNTCRLILEDIDCPSKTSEAVTFTKIKRLIEQLVDAALHEITGSSQITSERSKLQMMLVFSEVDRVITKTAFHLALFYKKQLNCMLAESQGSKPPPPVVFGDYCCGWIIRWLFVHDGNFKLNGPLEKILIWEVTTSDGNPVNNGSTMFIEKAVLSRDERVPLVKGKKKQITMHKLPDVCTAGAILLPSGELFARKNHAEDWAGVGYYNAPLYIKEHLAQKHVPLEKLDVELFDTDPQDFVKEDQDPEIGRAVRKEIELVFRRKEEELNQTAKKSEANAKDWGSAVTQNVRSLEGDMKDKVKIFEDTAKSHEEEIENRVTGHERTVDYKLKQAATEQRRFMETMENNFQEYQNKLIETYEKHKVQLQQHVDKEEERLKKQQNEFAEKQFGLFQEYKTQLQQSFEELKNELTHDLKTKMEISQKNLDGNVAIINEKVKQALDICKKSDATSASALEISKKAEKTSAETDKLSARKTQVQKLETRVTTVEKLEARVVKCEKLEPRVSTVEKLETRIAKLERLEAQVASLEKLQGRVNALEKLENRIAKLEKLEARVSTLEKSET